MIKIRKLGQLRAGVVLNRLAKQLIIQQKLEIYWTTWIQALVVYFPHSANKVVQYSMKFVAVVASYSLE